MFWKHVISVIWKHVIAVIFVAFFILLSDNHTCLFSYYSLLLAQVADLTTYVHSGDSVKIQGVFSLVPP